jgi:hypothetical protein
LLNVRVGGPACRHACEALDDGWGSLAEVAAEPSPRPEALRDRSRTITAENRSPDIPFDQSINPYRGCEHPIRIGRSRLRPLGRDGAQETPSPHPSYRAMSTLACS